MSKQTQTQSKSTTSNDEQTQAEPGFDPAQPFAFGFQLWSRAARDHMDRVQSFWDELAEFEGEAYRRTRQSAQQMGAMFDESLAYVANLSAQWRELAMTAARKSNEILSQA